MSTRVHKTAVSLQQRLDSLCAELAVLRVAVRAVIDAGRPHDLWLENGQQVPCDCAKCKAWDALKKALEA